MEEQVYITTSCDINALLFCAIVMLLMNIYMFIIRVTAVLIANQDNDLTVMKFPCITLMKINGNV